MLVTSFRCFLLLWCDIDMGQILPILIPAVAKVVVELIRHLSKPPEKPLPMPEQKKQENGKFASLVDIIHRINRIH